MRKIILHLMYHCNIQFIIIMSILDIFKYSKCNVLFYRVFDLRKVQYLNKYNYFVAIAWYTI